MRLLITGWHGQIARAFIDAAPARNDLTACALGRPALDICEIRTIERALGDVNPSAVINTAGYTAVDQAEDEPDRAHALNRDGARLIAEAAARRGVPIIHLSSDYVFDGTKSAPYVETDTPAPASVYGHSKLAGEAAVRDANPRHVILRTSWVYSPFGRNFVRTMRERAADGAALRVVNDQFGSPTYAPHLVDAIFSIASRVSSESSDTSPIWGTYHAAGSGVASWHDLAAATLASPPQIADTSLTGIGTADYPTRARRPQYSVLDCGKLEHAFGLRLPDWREGVAECVERLSTSA